MISMLDTSYWQGIVPYNEYPIENPSYILPIWTGSKWDSNTTEQYKYNAFLSRFDVKGYFPSLLTVSISNNQSSYETEGYTSISLCVVPENLDIYNSGYDLYTALSDFSLGNVSDHYSELKDFDLTINIDVKNLTNDNAKFMLTIQRAYTYGSITDIKFDMAPGVTRIWTNYHNCVESTE